MGFLSWLFALGGLAIILPVLFHLIRPAPKGRMPFGSLMFLRQSPPRVTRRSRIDNWLLLLLRGLAIGIIAFAFMRPFLRSAGSLLPIQPTRPATAILIDVSASMNRPGVWEQALQRAREALSRAGNPDQVGLYSFSDQVTPLVPLGEQQDSPGDERMNRIQAELARLRPGFQRTALGECLSTLSGMLAGTSLDKKTDKAGKRIVLISDLQEGADLQGAGAESWPENVSVEIVAVKPAKPGNVSIRLLDREDLTHSVTEPRLRITNDRDSLNDSFRLGWGDEEGNPVGTVSISQYVAAGDAVVVSLPLAAETPAGSIVVSGDEAEFDNQCFVADVKSRPARIDWFGGSDLNDTTAAYWFLTRLFPDSSTRSVRMTSPESAADYAFATNDDPQLAIVHRPVAADELSGLQKLVERGGTVFVAVADRDTLDSVAALVGAVAVSDRKEKPDYLMLTRINFAHPVFASLAGSRYNDFSAIRFWESVPVTVDEQGGGVSVIARFDNGDPAIWERRIGEGTVIAMATSWRPSSSQLALSSRFLPLMWNLLELSRTGKPVRQYYEVGDSLALPAGSAGTWTLTGPGGTNVAMKAGDSGEVMTFRFIVPGRYQLESGEENHAIAVNIAPSESLVTPLPAEKLESLGIRRQQPVDVEQEATTLRKLGESQLEARQGLWKWLLVSALGLLVVESLLAGRKTRSQFAAESAAL
jgi:Aerotolerance regulator N-terminal/von Willebrand factor type A domain